MSEWGLAHADDLEAARRETQPRVARDARLRWRAGRRRRRAAAGSNGSPSWSRRPYVSATSAFNCRCSFVSTSFSSSRVRGDQRERRRRLEGDAALGAENRVAEVDRRGRRHSGRPSGVQPLDERDRGPSFLPSSDDGAALPKSDDRRAASSAPARGCCRDRASRAGAPRVVRLPAADRRAPEALVDRVARRLRRDRRRRAVAEGASPLRARCRASRTGARTSISGARTRRPASKRNWSLPAAVEPCAIARRADPRARTRRPRRPARRARPPRRADRRRRAGRCRRGAAARSARRPPRGRRRRRVSPRPPPSRARRSSASRRGEKPPVSTVTAWTRYPSFAQEERRSRWCRDHRKKRGTRPAMRRFIRRRVGGILREEESPAGAMEEGLLARRSAAAVAREVIGRIRCGTGVGHVKRIFGGVVPAVIASPSFPPPPPLPPSLSSHSPLLVILSEAKDLPCDCRALVAPSSSERAGPSLRRSG